MDIAAPPRLWNRRQIRSDAAGRPRFLTIRLPYYVDRPPQFEGNRINLTQAATVIHLGTGDGTRCAAQGSRGHGR